MRYESLAHVYKEGENNERNIITFDPEGELTKTLFQELRERGYKAQWSILSSVRGAPDPTYMADNIASTILASGGEGDNFWTHGCVNLLSFLIQYISMYDGKDLQEEIHRLREDKIAFGIGLPPELKGRYNCFIADKNADQILTLVEHRITGIKLNSDQLLQSDQ